MWRHKELSYTNSESPQKMLSDDMLWFVFVYDALCPIHLRIHSTMSSRWSLPRSICNVEHVILSRISDDTSSHSLRSARGTWRSISSQWWWNLKTWWNCWQWWWCLMAGMIWMILIHSFSLELEFVVRNKNIKWQTLRSGNQLDICLISYVDIYMIIMLSNHAFGYPVCEIYYVT